MLCFILEAIKQAKEYLEKQLNGRKRRKIEEREGGKKNMNEFKLSFPLLVCGNSSDETVEMSVAEPNLWLKSLIPALGELWMLGVCVRGEFYIQV